MPKEMKGYSFSDNKVGEAVDKASRSSGDAYGGITGIISKLGTGGTVKGQDNQKEKG